MISRLLQWIREVWQKMIGTTNIKQALNVDLEMSSDMVTALQQWSRMYQNDASWLNNYIKSLNLPAAIAGEIARAVTIEMAVEVSAGANEDGKTKSNARAAFLAEQMEKVIDSLRERLEYGCAKGGLVFKPYPKGKVLGVDYVQADQFYPVNFDASGNITAAIFSDQRKVGDSYFTRLELHELTDSGYFVRNKAFKSSTKDTLGSEVTLASVDIWAELQPEATITGVDKPLFAYFRFPAANNVDPTSPLGVSCYARAVDLIEQADRQWSDLLWEFDSGKRALYAEETAFARDDDGKPILPNKRLYRTLGAASEIGKGEMFKEWSPSLREEHLLRGLDAILKRIEFNCGLAYGTLSDPQQVDKTATEIQASKQRSAATIVDTQKALEASLDHLLYAMDFWATLYNLAPKGAYEAVYEFDDSLVIDHAKQFSQDSQVVGMRAMSKVEFRMRNYGESEDVAREKVAMVAEEQPDDMFREE